MQVVVGFGKIPQAAVLVEDQNSLGHVSFVVDACVAHEVGGLFVAESKMCSRRLDALLNFLVCEGLRTKFDPEQAAIEQPLAQQGQHAVFVVPPGLHRHEDVAVVEFAEAFEDLGVGQKFGPVQVVVQEQRQGG